LRVQGGRADRAEKGWFGRTKRESTFNKKSQLCERRGVQPEGKKGEERAGSGKKKRVKGQGVAYGSGDTA